MLTVSVLRDGLLDGRAIALVGDALAPPVERLGARVELVSALDGDEERLGEWARAVAPLSAVVYDARPAFGSGGDAALTESLEQGWVAVREVATGALIPAEAGKVVLVGPVPDAGPRAEAARAGLENLARTLSVEWARHGVTTTMVAPGPSTSEAEVAELVCFLVSPAGEYLDGCRLELGATGM
jgi:NAD(P)-dependent dehydrogenase (short-subunit alcohol dehydrogenase family)